MRNEQREPSKQPRRKPRFTPHVRSAWTPPYAEIPLDAIEVAGDVLVLGSKKHLVEYCRERGIHQASITPYYTRLSRGYLLQGGCFEDRYRNCVELLSRDHGWKEYRLRSGAPRYQMRLPLEELGQLLDRIGQDYPAASLTATLAACLESVVRLWLDARTARCSHVDGRSLDETIASHLNPFVRAWLRPDIDYEFHPDGTFRIKEERP